MKNELTWVSENSCFLLGMKGAGEEACGGDLQSIPERARGLLGGREAYRLPFAARFGAWPRGLGNPFSFNVLIFYVVLRVFL